MSDELHDLVRERMRTPGINHQDLGLLIYGQFYLAAQDAGIVWTLYDLAVRDGIYKGTDENFDPSEFPEYGEHGPAIEHVMQLEVSIFVFRRMNGPWGEVIDGMLGNRNRFSNEYREATGYQVDTNQDEAIFS